MRASSYSSFLNAVIVVALTCTLVLNLISQTFFFFFFVHNFRGGEICLCFQIRFSIVKPVVKSVTYFIITFNVKHLKISGYTLRDLETFAVTPLPKKKSTFPTLCIKY